LNGDERLGEEIRSLSTADVAPRLLVCLDGTEPLNDLRRSAAGGVTLPPPVLVDIADREAALTEIAAAMDAAA
jgi:hypothetical protein